MDGIRGSNTQGSVADRHSERGQSIRTMRTSLAGPVRGKLAGNMVRTRTIACVSIGGEQAEANE
jgi:hypothetical protein